MPVSLIKVLAAVAVAVFTAGLLAVCIELLRFFPLPDVATLNAQFWAGVPGGLAGWEAALWYARYGLFMLANLWVLGLVPLLGLAIGWLVVGWLGNEEAATYIERIYSLEGTLKRTEAREHDLATSWDKLHTSLDSLFESASEMWLVLDNQGKLLRWNTTALDFFRRWQPGLELTPGTLLANVFPGYMNTPLMRGVFEAGKDGKTWYGELAVGHEGLWVLGWVWPLGNEVAVVLRDVSHRHKPEAALHSADALVRQLVEESVRPVAVLDAQWNYLQVSRKWTELFAFNPGLRLVGQNHVQLIPSFPADLASIRHRLSLGDLVGQEDERTVINGREELLTWHMRPWRDASGKLGGYIFTVVNTTEQARLKAQLAQAQERENALAYADMLTGLPNRQLFHDRLNMALAQAYRQLGKVALLFLDLDGFKKVNDQLGHDAGDELLKQVAGRLQTCIRQTDTLARLGGDEFTMVLHVRDTADAEQVAKKVIRTLAEPFNLSGKAANIGTSIGIALYPQHTTHAADLLKFADTAMYAAKQGGKNTYRFYDPKLEKAQS